MQTIKSIFEIWISPTEILNKGELFRQIDKFIAKDWASSWDNEAKIQTWRRGDNCEIFIATDRDEITKITFRFDLEDINEKFRTDVFEFALSNRLDFLINQKILFDPRKLTRDLIQENERVVMKVDDPLTLLRSQMK